MSKIEQTIAEIEEYINNCKLQPLSNSKIIVNRNELEDMLEELRINIPDEIKKYQRIIANRDAILKDAQEKAEEMIKKANEMTIRLVSEHEIMQKAYKEADAVVNDAKAQAASIMYQTKSESDALKTATNQYLDDALANLQQIINESMAQFNSRYNDLASALETEFDTINRNRESYQANQAAIDSGKSRQAATYDMQNELDAGAETQAADGYDDIDQNDEYDMDNNGEITLM